MYLQVTTAYSICFNPVFSGKLGNTAQDLHIARLPQRQPVASFKLYCWGLQESEIQERASGAANASSSSSAGASTAFHSEDQGVQQVFPEQEQGKGSSEPDEDLILIFDQPDGSRWDFIPVFLNL